MNSVCQIFIFYTHFLENHSIFLNVDCVYLYWKKNKNKKPFKVSNFWLSRNYLFIARVLISVMIYAVLLFYGVFSTNKIEIYSMQWNCICSLIFTIHNRFFSSYHTLFMLSYFLCCLILGPLSCNISFSFILRTDGFSMWFFLLVF